MITFNKPLRTGNEEKLQCKKVLLTTSYTFLSNAPTTSINLVIKNIDSFYKGAI